MLRTRQVQLCLVVELDLSVILVQLIIVSVLVSVRGAPFARRIGARSRCVDPDNLRDYPLLVLLLDGKLELRNAARPVFGLHVAAVG